MFDTQNLLISFCLSCLLFHVQSLIVLGGALAGFGYMFLFIITTRKCLVFMTQIDETVLLIQHLDWLELSTTILYSWLSPGSYCFERICIFCLKCRPHDPPFQVLLLPISPSPPPPPHLPEGLLPSPFCPPHPLSTLMFFSCKIKNLSFVYFLLPPPPPIFLLFFIVVVPWGCVVIQYNFIVSV